MPAAGVVSAVGVMHGDDIVCDCVVRGEGGGVMLRRA